MFCAYLTIWPSFVLYLCINHLFHLFICLLITHICKIITSVATWALITSIYLPISATSLKLTNPGSPGRQTLGRSAGKVSGLGWGGKIHLECERCHPWEFWAKWKSAGKWSASVHLPLLRRTQWGRVSHFSCFIFPTFVAVSPHTASQNIPPLSSFLLCVWWQQERCPLSHILIPCLPNLSKTLSAIVFYLPYDAHSELILEPLTPALHGYQNWWMLKSLR